MFWKLDNTVVDATVDGIAHVFYGTAEKTHTMQDGNLSSMLRWMVIGLVALLVTAVIFIGITLNADAIMKLLGH
jgi:NADH-quinone oxidoreductase subunit L